MAVSKHYQQVVSHLDKRLVATACVSGALHRRIADHRALVRHLMKNRAFRNPKLPMPDDNVKMLDAQHSDLRESAPSPPGCQVCTSVWDACHSPQQCRMGFLLSAHLLHFE